DFRHAATDAWQTDRTRASEIAYTPRQRSADDTFTARWNDSVQGDRPCVARRRRDVQAFGRCAGRSYWRRTMLAKNAAKDVMAAVAVMEHARNACANLSPMGLPMSQQQIEHRARVIAAVINASRKLQQLRDRAVSLEDALARFKARKAELAA